MADTEERKAQKKAYQKAWNLANKEKIAVRQKAYSLANKEKIAAWKLANKEKIRETAKAYQLANKEKIAAYYLVNKEKLRGKAKAYHITNKEKIAVKGKAYQLANKEKIREKRKDYTLANREKKMAYQLANKERIGAQRKDYRLANKEKIGKMEKAYRLVNGEKNRAKKYGMTESQLFALIEKHGNSCALCGRGQEDLKHRLSIDHCHSTGVVRGILCIPCNTTIGVFGDTTESINRVILYLQGIQDKLPRDSDPKYYTRKIQRDKPERWSREKAKPFGMTHTELFELYETYNYCCALCKKPEADCKQRLAIDHCHETGRIRGLLCGTCNLALGKLGDTVESLLNARRYLEIPESN